jgi:dTDP-glucose 4,6-dehydratase
MKNLLVTGGAGFIGSNFVRYMLHKYPEYRLVVFDKLTYAGNLDNLRDLDDARYQFVRGDICDPHAVEGAIRQYGIDTIVNFAAETHVDRSISDGAEFLRTNVYGVQVLLEAVRELEPCRLVHVSTDEVYGDLPPGRSSTEDDPLRPSSPYSAAKAGGDLLVLSHVRTYGVDAVITRGSNTYGPNQYPEKLLPLFVTNALDGEPLPLYGDGKQVRDWLHVEDHCAAIELVLREGASGEVYNVGGGEEVENREITRRVLELTGADESLVRPVDDRPGHDRRYSLDSGKLEALGWKREWTLEKGVPQTVEWYRENRHWWEPIKQSDDFRAYYERQYPALLSTE